MKSYSKIVGIILTLMGLIALVCIIVVVFEERSINDKVIASLLFFPCIIFLHFMYIHNFGFNLMSDIPRNNYKTILVLTIVSLTISILVPGGYLLSQINLESKAHHMIDRGNNETDLTFTANLKTKFDAGKLLYVINISTGKNQGIDMSYYKSFLFNLYDKDGFLISKIDIRDFVTITDKSNNISSIISNSSEDFALEDYLKISRWELLYITD
jgi:hypothetical protein